MNKMKGFTLIELLVVIAIVGLVATALGGFSNSGTYCKGGYLFAGSGFFPGAYDRQIMGANGGGVSCQ